LAVFKHHFGEFIKGDFTVAIGINLLDDLVHDFFIEVLTEAEHLLDLIGRNGTTAILVEHLERSLELVVAEQVLLVHGSNDEFRVINGTTSISIDLVEHFIDLLVRETLTEVLSIAILDLFLGEFTIAVDVHGSEHLVDLLLLVFGQELGGDESESGLLKFGVSVEALEVAESAHCDVLGNRILLSLLGILDPWVLQGLLSRWSLFLLLGEKLSDEVLTLVGDLGPNWISKRDFAGFNFFHNFLVRRSIKWWDTRERDIRNDTAGPDIALRSVVLGKDFWSNVIRSSKLLIELLALVEDERGTEIDDLDLIEFLVLLKQDIFRL